MHEPHEVVHWVDPQGQQVGPEPLDTVRQRARSGQIPHTTLVWWEGAPDWTALHQIPGSDAPPAYSPSVATTASQALMSGLTDQELDDEFIGLVGRSWDMYKETEFATSIDEATLGGVITAMVDCGFVLIDLNTAGSWAVPATTGSTSTSSTSTTNVGSTVTTAHHELRFEEPETHARVTVAMEHLTPDPAVAKMIGHRASAIIGYGQRVPNFTKVGQAVRQEVQSGFVASPEPGTVTFDADISSGYVYAQIDLLLELERYVDEHLAVDHELLRRHLASVVYTMKTFIQTRFGS
ncbi:MAG: hypothetical protein QG671_1331 [Actinomycetota bacterium]|nr:hypothetical protein [Actinomycetota bacterium]